MRQIVSILIILSFVACKKKQTALDLGYNYVPLDSGITTIFQVRDIFHDVALIPAHDTNYYQIKTVVGESYEDDEGIIAHKIYRYRRETSVDSWTVKDVWTLRNTGTRIEITEENLRLIDFVFAPSITKTWDANALNEFEAKNSVFKSVHKPFKQNAFSFDSTCVVSHQAFTSFIDHNVEYDVFAKGLGKIHSVHKELTIDNFDTLDIQKGFEITYELIDFSK
ncbi:MAG: hypothetical protein R3279_02215 [Putridiphycobacter sp.]|nr:hypothetical protein [Putridiphycobacter sp.]